MKKHLLILIIFTFVLSVYFARTEGISDKTIIKLQIGSKIAYVDGLKTPLDVAPTIADGRTLVPIRFISEGLGAQVAWENSTKLITISMDSITYLKNQVATLESEKATLLKENGQLKDKVSQLEANIKTLNDQNAELEKKISDLEDALKKYQQSSMQVVEMHITYDGFKPNVFNVKKDIPVKWIIYGDQISSCTNKIIVPSLNISKSIAAGENVINFTPNTSGTIDFSCWMGMVRGKFVVN